MTLWSALSIRVSRWWNLTKTGKKHEPEKTRRLHRRYRLRCVSSPCPEHPLGRREAGFPTVRPLRTRCHRLKFGLSCAPTIPRHGSPNVYPAQFAGCLQKPFGLSLSEMFNGCKLRSGNLRLGQKSDAPIFEVLKFPFWTLYRVMVYPL